MTIPWLHVIGIGEDGVEALPATHRALIAGAELVAGGARHLALAAPLVTGRTLAWPHPLADGMAGLLGWRGRRVCVLASGDPFLFGIGTTLRRHVPMGEMACLPVPSSVALACNLLGWAEQDITLLSLCGRPMEATAPALQPGGRLVVLSADEHTPHAFAQWLDGRGFGGSTLHILGRLGGGAQTHQSARVADVARAKGPDVPRLNLMALEVVAARDALVIPLACGLPDDLFAHDGQITKREIRAATLSALAPRRGEVLWDIGAGSGSISIEWMLRHPANRAIAVEKSAIRRARIAHNALNLGVPALQVVAGEAPACIARMRADGLPAPNAIFLGGGISNPGMLEAAWQALPPGGRLVANAVTLESEACVMAAHARWGGTLTRLQVERLEAIGRFNTFRPGMTVTSYAVTRTEDRP
ncbi:bifunctional cobalt-precorrin-7 (C(5))-methyltransferase/cobalt-precorrin-6B (C(15))-methyltransferase [Komagataeibacter rhaeticus]|uniref:Bifunctional cobalt-precorrin-7 (C(5))-methyltransferase/cobalt-precorrin-6B (C(15))-methyltransferase n=1 Tax=Komagataeibacter rhaeticus TaxID=215221 RepID=A0A181C6R9_9PROT|nr:bifunctional cobalt-precorrin-7 (C(5))-methyltransferase/cobalt-precorrin-6B (C(15))-methyltransferase [Komagataeibacter rhaeticus]KDU94797.1 precorrin-6Y C5,15-methyltransferase [Komagataeibacter rhaeticus AF1]MBL7240324.1 bifunctional cobalt-precorrin-7 (C(5))-methyltransferase/cobalt-precorrin-6B (C(15))-methyltransferase [Komagataeibacter rhaeticus]PYD55057.1 bifunctional cobalt-precorrin-7 (C(5))-methyltransferase/cobalt-precorrin-6B (C(15))-methyltransferase [Komagataeibacter rhaeticus]